MDINWPIVAAFVLDQSFSSSQISSVYDISAPNPERLPRLDTSSAVASLFHTVALHKQSFVVHNLLSWLSVLLSGTL